MVEALEFLGAPLAVEKQAALATAGRARDAAKLQQLLDPEVLVAVQVNPEARVKAARGPAAARLQQAGWTPVLVKVVNESGVRSGCGCAVRRPGRCMRAWRN